MCSEPIFPPEDILDKGLFGGPVTGTVLPRGIATIIIDVAVNVDNIFHAYDNRFLRSTLANFVVPGPTKHYLVAEVAIELVTQNEVTNRDLPNIVFFWTPAIVVDVVDAVDTHLSWEAPAISFDFTLA